MTKEDYAQYCKFFEEIILPMYPKAKRFTEEQYKLENYRDNVYEYVEQEWTGVGLHEVFYKDVDFNFDENVELTAEEERGYMLQDGVDNIIKDCYSRGESVTNCGGLVYDFLKKQNAD